MKRMVWKPVFANDLDAFIPEVWAQESLMVLEANMVMANLVHRDFENEIANQGDTVNTRRPGTFEAVRKTDTDDVTVQDSEATNVAVKLDQHLHTTFLIRDGEESKGFKNLRNEYLIPGLVSIAQAIDTICLGQMYEFMDTNVVGKLGTDPTKTTIIAAREKMNTNKAPLAGRNMVITPNTEGALLGIADFVTADKVGDEGTALREGSLGKKFGMSFFMSQNTPSVATGSATDTAAINNGNISIGDTVLTIDGTSETYVVGAWVTIAGDMVPQQITAVSGTPTTQITVTPGLRSAVVNEAVVTYYTPGLVNLLAGYDAAYSKALVVDGFTVAPKSGQLVSFAGTTPRYSALGTPTTTSLTLNRTLDAAVANNAVIGLGPTGDYNFAFHRNCMTLVMRPLAKPADGTGALSYVANYNGMAIRVTITYDGNKQGHLVTVDVLCGVKTLDTDLGVVMLG